MDKNCGNNNSLAIFIAFLALVVSIWQGVISRNHNKLSVIPILTISDIFLEDNYCLEIANGGTGPAVIDKMSLFTINDKNKRVPQNDWYDLIHKLNGECGNDLTQDQEKCYQHCYFDKGEAIRPGEIVKLLFIKNPKDIKLKEYKKLKDFFKFIIKKIEIKIEYKSIYNEYDRKKAVYSKGA